MIVSPEKQRQVRTLMNVFLDEFGEETVHNVAHHIHGLINNILMEVSHEAPPSGVLRMEQDEDSVNCEFIIGVFV